MNENIPPKNSWDDAWLFTKVTLFLGVVGLGYLGTAILSVWMGTVAFMTTENMFLGIVIGIMGFFCGHAGRDYLQLRLVSLLFSVDDHKEIDRRAG